MKRIDLFDQLKDETRLIFVMYDVDLDLEDDDAIDDFVCIDLEDLDLEPEDRNLIITYNYLLQMKAAIPQQMDIFVEIK